MDRYVILAMAPPDTEAVDTVYYRPLSLAPGYETRAEAVTNADRLNRNPVLYSRFFVVSLEEYESFWRGKCDQFLEPDD